MREREAWVITADRRLLRGTAKVRAGQVDIEVGASREYIQAIADSKEVGDCIEIRDILGEKHVPRPERYSKS